MLKITAATGVAAAAASVAGPAHAKGGGGWRGRWDDRARAPGLQAIEAFPTSPLILNPFTDPLPVPQAARPVDTSKWTNKPSGASGCQDSDGYTHQMWPGQAGTVCANMPQPIIYQNKLQVAAHSFTSSPVRTLVPYTNTKGKVVPAGTVVSRLPASTIYGFNGKFPGPMINAEYGKPCLVRFENHLDENPLNLDRGDFGAPDWTFLTHLHNAHTAAGERRQPALQDGRPTTRPAAGSTTST